MTENEVERSQERADMNVSLTPELEQYVQEKVKSGMYYWDSEVIREGLRCCEDALFFLILY